MYNPVVFVPSGFDHEKDYPFLPARGRLPGRRRPDRPGVHPPPERGRRGSTRCLSARTAHRPGGRLLPGRRLRRPVQHPRRSRLVRVLQRQGHRLRAGELPHPPRGPHPAHRRHRAGDADDARQRRRLAPEPARHRHHGLLGRRTPGIDHRHAHPVRTPAGLPDPGLPGHHDGPGHAPGIPGRAPGRGTEESGPGPAIQQRTAGEAAPDPARHPPAGE